MIFITKEISPNELASFLFSLNRGMSGKLEIEFYENVEFIPNCYSCEMQSLKLQHYNIYGDESIFSYTLISVKNCYHIKDKKLYGIEDKEPYNLVYARTLKVKYEVSIKEIKGDE